MDTPVRTIAPPRLSTTEAAMCAWLGKAAPGDRLVYHRGFLAVDLSPANVRLTTRERAELRRVARRAMLVAERGVAHLVQRRNGPDDFSYLLIARARPGAAYGSLAALLAEDASASDIT